MAKETQSSRLVLDDNTQYSVRLARTITVGSMKIRPRDAVILKGKIIKGLDDGVATDITAVADGGDQSE